MATSLQNQLRQIDYRNQRRRKERKLDYSGLN